MILEYLHENEHLAWYVFKQLRKEWPQINEHTKIAAAKSYEVHIPKPMPSRPANSWKHPVETWKDWRQGFFWYSPRLEDPEHRWAYQKSIAKRILRIPKLIKSWLRGEMKDSLPESIPMPDFDTLYLKNFGWYCGVNDLYRIMCDYYPPSDTLFVFKKWVEPNLVNYPHYRPETYR